MTIPEIITLLHIHRGNVMNGSDFDAYKIDSRDVYDLKCSGLVTENKFGSLRLTPRGDNIVRAVVKAAEEMEL